MCSTLIARLKTLNFFASPVTANNEYELQNERISTRLFIVTLLLCVLVIFTYTAQASITQTIDVKNPSYEQFQSLSLRYSQTLRCPCDNVAIPHSSFISLEPRFHQLCSSGFIQQDWIHHIGSAIGTYVDQDFGYTGSLIFLTLAAFCRRANDTVMTDLETFNLTRFITAQALTKNVFDEQVKAVIQSFQSSTELDYYQLFNLIQFSTQTNTLMSALFSNINLFYVPGESSLLTSHRFYVNGTCDCDTTSSCVEPLTLQDRRTNQGNSSSFFTIPGLFKGCYLVEAIRQSSLECFYQAWCIAMIEQYLQAPVTLNQPIFPLNSTIESRFNISSTVDQLLSKAMTEQWQENVSHDQYFVQCEVPVCTYSFTSKFNIVYIVTTLIGLVGGLTKVLRLLIPRIVKFIRRRFVPLPPPTNEPDVVHVSLLQRLRTFNYFSKPSVTVDERETNQQIIATRIFFLLLTISFIILISYYGTQNINILYRIESPTFEQFIDLESKQHSNPSFSCPCSTITITYEKFIHVSYILHPFCSSDFVQQQWLNYAETRDDYFFFDFRALTPVFFHSLASFCQVSVEYIDNSLRSFNASLFIADKALSSETLLEETNSIVKTFILATNRSFVLNFALISNTTRNNGLISTHMTNFGFFVYGTYPSYQLNSFHSVHFIPSGNISMFCQCIGTKHCVDPLSIYPYISSDDVWGRLATIPGLFLDCLMMEGIRHSTLVCLFNQSCVDLMSFWLNISNVNAIDTDDLIHFDVNSTVDNVINELFVDQWNYSTSHRAFYQQCRPDRCTYSLYQHNSFWLILTAIISLIGGLMKIFQIIVPYFVRGMFALHSRCHHRAHTETIASGSVPFTLSFQFIVDRLRKLNLFSSDNPTNADEEHDIRSQIISTRIFLVLLLTSLVILTIYSSQVQVTKIVSVANPSIQQYVSLYKSHSSTLTCPCKNIAILQRTFLNLQPTFHQVCGSDFVNPLWSNGIESAISVTFLYFHDFRFLSGAVFDTIASLCQLSLTTINDGLSDFGESSFVTAQTVPQNLLLRQGQALIDLFISTSENVFISTLRTIRDTTQANGPLSGYATSSAMVIEALDQTNTQVVTYTLAYGDSSPSCSCYSDPTCTEPAGLFSVPNGTLIYSIPGFLIGCYITEATLQSNLRALYNQSWIDHFRATIQFDTYNPIYVKTTALNSSLDSQYNITTPINIMVQKMMTESWYTNVNYSAYYEQCDPIECKYTYVIKYDLVYIITTIIGLIGGLVTILQLVIPRAVKLIRRCWFNRRRHTRVEVFPAIQIPENN